MSGKVQQLPLLSSPLVFCIPRTSSSNDPVADTHMLVDRKQAANPSSRVILIFCRSIRMADVSKCPVHGRGTCPHQRHGSSRLYHPLVTTITDKTTHTRMNNPFLRAKQPQNINNKTHALLVKIPLAKLAGPLPCGWGMLYVCFFTTKEYG
ncbi:hypothetical protein NPIL_590171 [Nephila pilipes]|uniref:Uncharacterized protein n=1 Tax=Nephila pilipes TaxID=299642 RepID=A0A8X6TLN0_NEPPI|nr:hypothetical protein NPIL_590171 [Nephila pilipes]